MNKYIIPICIIPDSKVYNEVIIANSYTECQDKLMEKYSEYSSEVSYHDFIEDLDNQDILIGKITDIEEL